jgi:acetyltransferase
VPRGNRVGLITNTGGPAIIAMDVLVDAGLSIPPLSEKAREALKVKLYPEASINNPIDVLATGGGKHFRVAIDAMMDEDQIDSLYINFVTPFFVDTESIAKEIAEVNRQKKKPIICNLMTDKRQWTGTLNILRGGGVPSYSFPSTAARALSSLVRYAGLQSAKEGKIRQFGDIDRNAAEKLIKAAREKGKVYLSAGDVYTILSAYKIPAAPWKMAGNPAQAADAAREIGFPVAVKADSETLVHKTDSGGVLLWPTG